MELLLRFSLEDDFTDELDLSLLLLDESSDFTELELLESDEFFVPFTELLDPSVTSTDLLSLEIASSLSLERESLDSSRLSLLRMTLLSSSPVDEELSQAERAKNAANSNTYFFIRTPVVNFTP
jgi:hypothetical protein